MRTPKTSYNWYAGARENRLVGHHIDDNISINLAGCYDYLSQAYYVSQDYENNGRPIRPTCKEMLDAYVPPLFLEKARLAELPIPEYYISNGYFEPPVIVDPVNPFIVKGHVVLKATRMKHIARSLTRNFTYAICCQDLPPGSRVFYFRSVLGWCHTPVWRDLSNTVWRLFNIPLALVRVVILSNGQYLLSDISPLRFDELGVREIHFLEEQIRWDN